MPFHGGRSTRPLECSALFKNPHTTHCSLTCLTLEGRLTFGYGQQVSDLYLCLSYPDDGRRGNMERAATCSTSRTGFSANLTGIVLWDRGHR